MATRSSLSCVCFSWCVCVCVCVCARARARVQGRVLVGCRRVGQSLRLCVYDTGVGVPLLKRGENIVGVYVAPTKPGAKPDPLLEAAMAASQGAKKLTAAQKDAIAGLNAAKLLGIRPPRVAKKH